MAAKIIANLIVMGSGILSSVSSSTYNRFALEGCHGNLAASIALKPDAAKSGVAQETLQNAARRVSKVMTEQEARQILGVTEDSAWEEIVKASSVFILCPFVTVN
ncbi:hypothetical protein EZV62_001476 [Acer yangbiense]|uniref:Uncharacterized protein n=1 Tax=Acer yangbiense TaxID=1000413 RepID=A0A5C7IU50_9ROSI|nr:hypothetical protein EZV62_001476 [Acer yangbiense]